MAKNILKKILTVIGYHAPDIARIITIVMCIIMTGHWIAVNKDGMNVFIVLFSVLVIYPLLGLVLSVLIIIPSFICRMILYALGNDANAEDHYSYTHDNNSDSNNTYSNAENGYQRYQNQQQGGRYYGYSGYGYNSGKAGYVKMPVMVTTIPEPVREIILITILEEQIRRAIMKWHLNFINFRCLLQKKN